MAKLIAFGAALALAGAAPAGAALVVNGGFESPGGTVRDTLTAAYVPGWSYDNSNGNALDIYEDDSQDGLAAADGNHYVSFGHNGTNGGSITQTVATVAGHAYKLSLWTAEQQGHDPAQLFEVSLVTALGGSYSFSIGNLTSTFTETTQEFFPDSPTTISIFDATPAGSGAASNLALDRVSVVDLTAGAVPEPASWGLMLAGFGVVGALARRQRAVAA